MPSISSVLAVLSVLLPLVPRPAAGQARAASPDDVPVCAGVAEGLFAVALRPGESEAELRERIRAGGASADTPVLHPDSAGLRLANPDHIRRLFARRYPRALRDQGIGGTVLVVARIDEDGTVASAQAGSGRAELDEAALSIVREMRFSPAVHRGCRIPVLLRAPIEFFVRP